VKSIQIESVSKSYTEDTLALDEVSLDLSENSFTCLLGPSGCGKSTLLNMIAGFIEPTTGHILVDGREVTHAGADRGVVFQEYALFPWRTAIENVEFGPMVQGVTRAERRATARQYLALVGLAEHESKYPRELSGGMKQRVAIARALAMRPEVMLFDEPTSALDPEMISEVLDVMVALSKQGMTMIVVTHEMGFARAVADRVVFVDEGRVVEDAAPAEFFTRPRTERGRAFLDKILH